MSLDLWSPMRQSKSIFSIAGQAYLRGWPNDKQSSAVDAMGWWREISRGKGDKVTAPWKPDPLAHCMYDDGYYSQRKSFTWGDGWRVLALVVALLLTCIWW